MREYYKNIFNIPASASFWDNLAKVYLKKFEDNKLDLASVLFLVANRRNCQSLINAFIRQQGLKPTILPTVVPISEIDDDELFFSGFDIEDILPNIENPISREERLFLLTRMIMSKPNDFGIKQLSPAQALNLALDLTKLLDTCYNQGLGFDKLYDLVPEKYATHWQETLKLLKIITLYWPQILEERGAIDVCKLKNYVLTKQAEIWEKNPSKHIVIAGVTASFPAYVKLMNTVIKTQCGEIYFSGIDKDVDDEYWNAIDEIHPYFKAKDEGHPYFEIKDLLNKLNLDRHLIKDICLPENKDRELLVAEVIRPAIVSYKWRDIAEKFNNTNAIEGISLMNCKNQRDEALAIALKMREVLTKPEKTACLVTYDRGLARRVSSELKRFGIVVDDSAGVPLSLNPIGIYLRLIAEFCYDTNSQTKLIGLLKNPFTLMGHSNLEFRSKVYKIEKEIRRFGIEGVSSCSCLFLNEVKEKVYEFVSLLQQDKIDFGETLKMHIKLAEELACSNDKDGKNFLWRGDSGKCAVNFITKILNTSSLIGNIKGKDYLSLLSLLMSNETVRASFGTHPRLSILGPIEAQLQHFDYVIIGEVNEGGWPKGIEAEMWMSRPMMVDFGLNLPEKNIGILGFSFASFMMAENVILTRAERIGETPTQKSRWLLRLETVLNAINADIKDLEINDFVDFANKIDAPLDIYPISAPCPCPPVEARPRTLSASALDLLIDDPYSVFAKYILKLYSLNDLDRKPDMRDYGTLVHSIVEEFNNICNSILDDNALDILIEIGRKHFDKKNLDKDIEAFWWPKFLMTAEWIIDNEKDYRCDVKKINNEIEGCFDFELPNGNFVFTAKADRIDELKDNSINIFDYKTGNIPTENQMRTGHAMQLLLEGIIARNKGYDLRCSQNVNKLIYWRLGKEKLEINSKIDELLDEGEEYIKKLINTFDFPTTPYHSRPTPKFVPKNRDYEHLARIREWSVQDSEDGGDE